ncbi:MAG: hypothetical protein JO222_07325, partial [Frankiales bacterium]|nr:hypothetical protein [Frankiales bacterium]
FENFATCAAFRQAVVGAQLSVVVIAHSPVRPTPEFSWMSAGGSTVVYADRQQTAFRVDPTFNAAGCPAG